MAYEDYAKANILEPIGIDNMHIGHSQLMYRHAGEVHYYGTETSLAQSVFPEITEFTPWPYGGFYLEAMDSHGGWIASATDLARFSYALESTNPNAVINSESRTLMASRPDIPLWEGTESYYAFGWQVRPVGKSANLWHAGSLPETMAMLYRTSGRLTWAALFNTRLDTAENEFMVDLITTMGVATIMDKVIWGSVIVFVLIGTGVIFFVR